MIGCLLVQGVTAATSACRIVPSVGIGVLSMRIVHVLLAVMVVCTKQQTDDIEKYNCKKKYIYGNNNDVKLCSRAIKSIKN